MTGIQGTIKITMTLTLINIINRLEVTGDHLDHRQEDHHQEVDHQEDNHQEDDHQEGHHHEGDHQEDNHHEVSMIETNLAGP